jgi:hypothetical protein
MATKSSQEITVNQASGIKNIFVNDWKPHFFDDAKKKIASIPFMRNLVEFTIGESDPTFLKLTSLLHWKTDSAAITESELNTIYGTLFKAKVPATKSKKTVIDLITEQATTCMAAPAGANFENKIVLAIAIRIAAERFMVGKIADPAFVASITSNQTQALLTRFRQIVVPNGEASVLDRVTTMTPENIHLNSFMYEPILDMSDEHLRKLYADVMALK